MPSNLNLKKHHCEFHCQQIEDVEAPLETRGNHERWVARLQVVVLEEVEFCGKKVYEIGGLNSL